MPINYSVENGGTIDISPNFVEVGYTLYPEIEPYYTYDNGNVPVTRTYQWLRNGVVIAGATLDHYVVGAADLNTKITVRVTAASPGYIANVFTTAPTQTIVKGNFNGSGAAPIVSATPAGVLTVALAGGSIMTPVAPTLTYIWWRDGTPMSPAVTTSTYALKGSDWGHTISVSVTASKLGYNNYTLNHSASVDYSIVPNAAPTLNGSSRVGHTFFATLPFQYTTEDGNTVPTIYLQWYRAGVAIPGATNNAYVAVAADLGKVLTLRLTAAKPGYVAYISNMSTSPVLIGDLGSAPVLYATTNLAPLTITGSLGSGITQTGVTYAYQWYRTPSSAPGVPTPIAGATLASYKPVAPADTGQLLSIKIKVSKTAFTPFVTPLGGGAADYSVRGLGTPGIDNLAPEFHDEITAIPPSWLIGGSSGTPDVVSYQWLRNGAVIAGATGIAYDIEAAADRGAKLSVRITASHPGYLATTVVSRPR